MISSYESVKTSRYESAKQDLNLLFQVMLVGWLFLGLTAL